MTKKRDTVVYELKDGRKVVYRGITNNPERRQKEHRIERMKFTKMNVITRKMTEEGAIHKEKELLKTYRKNHTGKNPKYNRNLDG